MTAIFDLLPLFFGLLAGGVVALQVFTSVSGRMRHTRAQHRAKRERVNHASRMVRERAQATLALRREERQMEVELEELDRSITDGEATAEREKRAETQLYVFDERKNLGDQAFLLTISHSDFNNLAKHAPPEICQSWRTGRRYMVWAASEKMAMAKATMRFNQDKGYRVSDLAPFAGDPEDL
jgi:hypothetical protein